MDVGCVLWRVIIRGCEMSNMKVLHLPIKKRWFDMIKSRVKKEEYRQVKPYWINRLADELEGFAGGDFMDLNREIAYKYKPFTHVLLKNGYARDSPVLLVEVLGLDLALGRPEWGAPTDEQVFILKLGEIVEV